MTTIDPQTPTPNPLPDTETGGAPKWIPTILLHILYPDSRKVGFAWMLWILSSWAAFFGHTAAGAPLLDASTWLICTAFASGLIGAGTILDAKNDLAAAKVAAGAAPAGS